ncbi:MAG: 4-alpha-glucanotransferase [Dehalococcoidales bacterium]|nr:4-alpha-glucanotransferase [Dehalococcoidales bacterium]
MDANKDSLGKLARLYGIQTAYYDVNHRRQTADPDALLAILHALGAPVRVLPDTATAIQEKQQATWQQMLEPVQVAWDGGITAVPLRLPASLAQSPIHASLRLEHGETRRYDWRNPLIMDAAEIAGDKYITAQLLLQEVLPPGYHRLTIEAGQGQAESLIISAPMKAYDTQAAEQKWGVFLPLYALHTGRSIGSGDYVDLATLAVWAGQRGAGVVATLPLLPIFAETGADPSPYNPISRQLWNEAYLNIETIPELSACPPAQEILSSSSFQKEATKLEQSKLVDYPRVAALKKPILKQLCRHFFTHDTVRREEFERFIAANPVIADYARFRAAGEQFGLTWRNWPQRLSSGTIKGEDCNPSHVRYHEYTQWLAHQQMQCAAERARRSNISLYLDLPQGVHPDGYDVWRERDIFLPGVTAGAPPDTVFTRGQDWAFSPLHPDKLREHRYAYTIACLHHHLKYAGILRIDHMMGFHRLFCIPHGMPARRGVYLHYRAEELYAILTLESCRHNSIIVGEDLGTVPPYVRPAMKKHGLNRMYVLHYELASRPEKGPPPVSRDLVASLNTHDMPPFASAWDGSEIEMRRKLGLLDSVGAATEQQRLRIIKKALGDYLRRKGWLTDAAEDTATVLKACLSFLSASDARLVLVNLEDLWGETQPQNVPAVSGQDYPSWRRKTRYSFEEFCRLPEVNSILKMINDIRSGKDTTKGIR